MKASTPITLAPLRAAWERRAQRIDALSLRERAILFLSIVAVLAALFDALVLSPLSTRARLRGEAQAAQAAEVAQLRQQFVAASQNVGDPAGQLQLQLDKARAERERLDGELRKAGSISGGEGLATVLQRLLAREPGLVLEQLALLADAPATPAQASASAPAGVPGVSWQGVELQVQGGYQDIQRYLQALERELPGLRWGELHLSAPGSAAAPKLRAQLFLLRVQP
ncbi:hypothetical protein ACG04Q_06050 [Roseateles sp. DXS20W]|uniref:MSHA biogenesis protein MshJ n=1 Tax=Pelomonas lactea TaxID=3299030 RepID=A0ABW7GGQ5_9BURK